MKHAISPTPTDPTWLNQQYNNRALVPDFASFFARWQAQSAAVRLQHIARLDLAYDDAQTGNLNQTLDIFPSINSHAPVVVFIHGGYWRSLDKSDHSFIAPALTQQGACVVVPNYALCPQSDGQRIGISDISLQMVKTLAWVYRHIAQFGGDKNRITVVGHSAGGHLAAMMLACDWASVQTPSGQALPKDLVKAAVSLSGLFDLAPLMHTPLLQADLQLTKAEVQRASPIHIRAPRFSGNRGLHCFVGAQESSEFIRQNGLLQTHWGKTVVPTAETIALCHHFSILDAMSDPSSKVYGAISQLLKPR